MKDLSHTYCNLGESGGKVFIQLGCKVCWVTLNR